MYVDLNCIVETIATLISITFISCLIAITIYKLIQSWDEGKERYLANEENERREELNKKRLENLKLENLEVKLTREDIELLNLIAGNKGTPKGVLRNMLRGFSEPEQVVYIYNQGREDYPVVFGQLTQKDGSFLVGREAEEDFDWSSLKGKEIIGGRPGGIPEMALEYVLKENGLDPENDVNMVTNVDFTATAGAFKSGTGDYVALFEPTATMLENDGGGSIVSSVGEQAGNIAYTCFYTTKSYMDENPEIIQKFTNAIYKGQLWVQQHTSEEIADSISSFFPGTDKDVIVKVIDNYKSIDAFSETPEVSEDGLNKLMDIIQGYDSSLIQTRPDFNVIVNNSFAEEATK